MFPNYATLSVMLWFLQVVLVSYMEEMSQTETHFYVTVDGGETFTKSVVPFYLDGSIVFHSTDANRLLAHSPNQQVSCV